MRPAQNVCKNCKAADKSGNNQYICHRHPPTPVFYGMGQTSMINPQPQAVVVAHYPVMLEDNWCFDFIPDLKS